MIERKLTLFPLFFVLYEFSGYLSNDMYLPAFLAIARSLQAESHQVQLTMTTWLAGMATAQFFLGPLSDRFGRRITLFWGGVVYLLSTLFCAMAPSIQVLQISRFFQGVGVGSMLIAGYASIHELYDDVRATRILAWMSSVAILAPMIGPLAGAYTLFLGGWRWVFWILFVISGLFLGLLWFVMPELEVDCSHHALHPLRVARVYWRILSNRAFLLRGAAAACMYSGIILWITASPFLLMRAFQMSPQTFGLSQVPVFIGFALGAQGVRLLVGRRPPRVWILSGMAVSAVSAVAMLALHISLAPSAWITVVAMSGFAFGVGVTTAPLTRQTLNSTTEGRGSATAIFFLLMIGGGALVSAVVSILPDHLLILSGLLSLLVLLALACKGSASPINASK